MSDNFVRRNLKRRGGACVAYNNRRNASAMSQWKKQKRARLCEDKVDGDADAVANYEEKIVPAETTTESSRFSSSIAVGVDPLTLSLDYVNKNLGDRVGSRKAVIGQAISSSSDDAKQAAIRGLNITAANHKSKVTVSDCVYNSRLLTKNMMMQLQEFAPRCPKHHMPAKLCTVHKPGNNKGRRFYGCAYPAEQRCQFFLWFEDNPELLPLICNTASATSRSSMTNPPPPRTLQSYCLSQYTRRLRQMNKPELLAEIRTFNRRIELSRHLGHPSGSGVVCDRKRLLVTGSKDSMIADLTREAAWWINIHCHALVQRERESGNTMQEASINATAETILLSDSDEDEDDKAKDVTRDDTVILSDSNEEGEIRSAEGEKEKMITLSDSEDNDNESRGEEKINPTPQKKRRIVLNDSDDDAEGTEDDQDDDLEGDNEDSDGEVGEETQDDTIVFSDSDNSDDDDSSDDHIVVEDAASFDGSFHATAQHIEPEDDVYVKYAKWYFGHDHLRDGQRWVLDKVTDTATSNSRALAVMPTGYGKSLCYLLPTIMHDFSANASDFAAKHVATIVISPLISLMNDQLRKLPPELPGACMTSQLTTAQSAELCADFLEGFVGILFVSPERFCTPSFQYLLHSFATKGNGKVNMICVDEVHCLSQWSYNFRSAYLRLGKIVDAKHRDCTLLALTATAGHKVRQDIAAALRITDNVLYLRQARKTLSVKVYHVDNEQERQQKCADMICASHKADTKAARRPLSIVYVWRRMQAEAYANYLTGKMAGHKVGVYHGGLDAIERNNIQQQFSSHQIQTIVGTVAFGMGIDIVGLDRIYHCTMPRSIEYYLQEIGRAGRHSSTAANSQCVLFYHQEDCVEQYALCFTTLLSKLQLTAFLSFLLKIDMSPCVSEKSTTSFLLKAMNYKAIEQQFDLSESQVDTILSLVVDKLPHIVSLAGAPRNDTVAGGFRVENIAALCAKDEVIRAFVQCNLTMDSNETTGSADDLLHRPDRLKLHKQQASALYGSDLNASGAIAKNPFLATLAQQRNEANPSHLQCSTPNLAAGNPSATGSQVKISPSFKVSLATLCNTLNTTSNSAHSLESVSKRLYVLQKAGILYYQLSDLSSHIVLQRRAAESLDISQLSDELLEQLNRQSHCGAQRCLQMWRYAYVMSKATDHNARNLANKIPCEDLQLFALDLMDSDCAEIEKMSDENSNSTKKQLESWYDEASPPFVQRNDEKKGGLWKDLKSTALMIRREPTISQLVEQWVKFCPPNIQSMAELKIAACSVMIAKALQAIYTPKLSAVYIRGSPMCAEVSGMYKSLEFCSLLEEIQSILSGM